MINFLAGLLALGFGLGLALWICGTKLDRSNNIGDSRGDGKTYHADTTFTAKCNRMDRAWSREYLAQHADRQADTGGPSGQDQVRRLTEDERRKKSVSEKKTNVPKGAFVSKNTSALSERYETPEWEKRVERDV